MSRSFPYLSGVDTPTIGSGHDVSAAGNVETFREGFVLGGGVAADNSRNGLHLFGLKLLPLRAKRVSVSSLFGHP